MLKHQVMRYALHLIEQAPPVIRGYGLGCEVGHCKDPVGELDMHWEEQNVVLKQVQIARPTKT